MTLQGHPTKVIDIWHQSKARIWLPIRPQ